VNLETFISTPLCCVSSEPRLSFGVETSVQGIGNKSGGDSALL